MKVVSTRTCFYHGRRWRPGEAFELPEGDKLSKGMTVVADKVEEKPKYRRRQMDGPETFSEITKQDADTVV